MKERRIVPSRSRRVALLGGVALAALVLLGGAGLPPREARAAAVALLMAAWWVTEAAPIAVTSLLPLALFPLLGVRSARAAAAAFADPAILLFLGGFLLALAMEAQGLARRVATSIAASRAGARPALLLGAFALATFTLSAWINNTATTMIMLPVALAATARSEPGLAKAVMLATAYFSSIGGVVTPIGTAPNILFFGNAARLAVAPRIGFLGWIAIALPIGLLVGLAAWGILAWRFRVPWRGGESAALAARALLAGLGRPTAGERRVGVLFLAAVALWVTRQDADLGGLRFTGWQSRLALPALPWDGIVAIAAGALALLVPSGARRPLLTAREAWRGIPWGIVLLLGGGFALADGLEASGLAARVGNAVASLRGVPTLLLVLAVTATMTFLSELTSNTAQASLVLPLMAAAAPAADVHPYILMVPAVLSCSLAFMMPAGTPPDAIVFASGRVTLPEMAGVGLLLNLVAVAVTTLAAPFLLRLVCGVG